MRLTTSVAFLAVLLSSAVTQGLAQGPCRVPTSSNEARLLYFYAAPLAFSMPVRPPQLGIGGISIGGDLTYIPEPPTSIQTSSLCYSPPKTEASNLSPVLPRPRIAVGLPFGFVVEASYLPPVTVSDATPNLFSVALSTEMMSLLMSATPVRLLVRAHATIGKVEGAITCSRAMLQQTSRLQACYGVNPSNDTYNPNIFGGEGVLAFGAPGARAGFYAGAGATALAPRFQVGFTTQEGAVDTTRVEPEKVAVRPVLLAGGWVNALSRLDLGVQLYSVPQDATVFRAGASFRVR